MTNTTPTALQEALFGALELASPICPVAQDVAAAIANGNLPVGLWNYGDNNAARFVLLSDAQMAEHNIPVSDSALAGRETSFVRYLRAIKALRHCSDTHIGELDAAIKTAFIRVDELTEEKLFVAYRTGPHSCMGGSGASRDALELYTHNPKQVALLTTKGYTHRALLWTDDDGVKLIDRNYPHPFPGFRMYVAKKYPGNWASRVSSVASQISGEPFTDGKHHTVTLANRPSRYPYLDSMVFAGGVESGVLFVTNLPRKGVTHLCHNAGGNPERITLQECATCMGVELKNMFKLGPDHKAYCRACWNAKFDTCRYCDAVAAKDAFVDGYSRESDKGNRKIRICATCAETKFSPCAHCGILFCSAEFTASADLFPLCGVCHAKELTQCSGCTQRFYAESALHAHVRDQHPESGAAKGVAKLQKGQSYED